MGYFVHLHDAFAMNIRASRSAKVLFKSSGSIIELYSLGGSDNRVH
jgi:hypothetical protein